MFRGNSDACISAIVGRLFDKEQKCLRQPLVICSQGTALLTKSCFRHSLHSTSTTMASVFIINSYQINFESVLMIPDHDGMLNMFKALEASGLRGFLGCESVLYEKELEQFFDTALVQGDDITGAVSGKYFSISKARFAQIFELPTERLVNFSEGVTTATDSLEFKSRFNTLDAKLLDGQVSAIRSEQLEFQAKIAADILSLSTQIGDLVDYIRGGDAKKGEGSSSRPQPTPDDQGRGGGDTGGGSGGVRTTTIVDRLSLEEVAERIREADRQRSNVDLERERNRERRERRLSRSGPSKRRRY
ncbi:hypothetical protein F511_38154 [Dorcoceras hygrometricum]|uniref:Uncharacterized protein n=1 Tax=Dorcoceras hygrometricum TaxID=472368 RepID=A0A2Z7BH94_9LAMI|nr:hypothetical protein F511_38154 [Dorcoceras hygrometricum]